MFIYIYTDYQPVYSSTRFIVFVEGSLCVIHIEF